MSASFANTLHTARSSTHDRLEQLAALAEEAGHASIARDAQALLERVREGRFFVACLGQFKRGKSTLINALLGEELLPSGIAPVTSVVTLVRFGERRARVRVGAVAWRDIPVEQLREYVSETHNPENQKNVTGVEVFCRSRFLERGLCLVDTPGVGSVFGGNTDETRSFVPHIDAAIIVLGGDPPLSGDELDLVQQVAKHVHSLMFVMNKADRLAEHERRDAVQFTRKVLSARVQLPDSILFEVSALEQLRGASESRQWPDFLAQLEALARKGSSELVARAADRGLEALANRLRQHLDEERAALLRPVEDSEQRLQLLRTCAQEAERASSELRYLFDAEQHKLARLFDEHRERFVADAMPELARQLDERLATATFGAGPRWRQYALREAQNLTEALVRSWMTREQNIAAQEFVATAERFVELTNSFLERLTVAGQLPADARPTKLVADTRLGARSHYYFESAMLSPPLQPWRWIADWFRAERSLRAAARAAGLAFAKELLQLNANRVVGDFDERVTESRRHIQTALRATLQETVTRAEQAAAKARELQLRGAGAVVDAFALLDSRSALLASLVGTLG